jgi:hypothetical protein
MKGSDYYFAYGRYHPVIKKAATAAIVIAIIILFGITFITRSIEKACMRGLRKLGFIEP